MLTKINNDDNIKRVIRDIYENCEICPLKDQTKVSDETNRSFEDEVVDILILAEAPSHQEVLSDRPLVGRSGKIFREVFESVELNKYLYHISNIVLCSNIKGGITKTPPKKAVLYCKDHVNQLIRQLKPKVILVMGATGMIYFNIAKINLLKRCGQFYEVQDNKVFLSMHPAYILRKGGLDKEVGKQFRDGFLKVKMFLDDCIEK